MSNIYLMGMNSHGSNYPWGFFLEFILKKKTEYGKVAVCFECSTYDMLICDVIRDDDRERSYNHFFSWWMKSEEVSVFIRSLDAIENIDVLGIDVSVQRLSLVDSSTKDMKKKCIFELLSIDSEFNYDNTIDDYSERELLMYKKIVKILNYNYDDVFVICHNFHASKKTWLSYKTVCQTLCENDFESHNVISIATISKRMGFIAKIDDRSLGVKTIDSCIREKKIRTYNVKMVSAFFRSEKEDALSLYVSIPEYYDHIEIFPCGEPVEIKGLDNDKKN